jgi:hypothetical protein
MVTKTHITEQDAEQAAAKLLSHLLNQNYSITELYSYTYEKGKPPYWRVRLDHPEKGKAIRPISFIDGKWLLKEPEFPAGKPLYNLYEISRRPDETVWVVEGEKCADALMKLGILATTSGSSSSAEGADWSPLYGRGIICWPDNDESGLQYAQDIKNILIIKILKIDFADLSRLDLPEKGDCVDWLRNNPNAEQSDIKNLPLISSNIFELEFDGWEEPVLFQHCSPPDIPATFLPGIFGDYAEALAQSVEVPEGLAVLGVLAAVSTAVSHRIKVSPKSGWEEPTNLYLLAALPPGNNKSAVIRACTLPLVEWEKMQAGMKEPEIKKAQSERKTMEELISRRRKEVAKNKDHDTQKREFHEIAEMEAGLKEVPALPQLFATDSTLEALAKNIHEQNGRFAVISDEGGILDVLAGLYNNNGRANINVILNGIDGGCTRVRRQETSIDINPILSFCLFVQPVVLQNMANQKAFSGKGLLERFLYFKPATKLGYRTHDTASIPSDIKKAYESRISDLLDIYLDEELEQSDCPPLNLSPEASEKFREFQHQIEKELRIDGKLYHISGWAGKVCGFLLRIAGLIHIMKHDIGKDEISLDTMSRALKLIHLLIDHAIAAFDDAGTDKNVEGAKILFNWIKRNGQCLLNKNECHRALSGRFKDVRQLEDALKILRNRNIITDPINVATGRKGRPSIVFRINPYLFIDRN